MSLDAKPLPIPAAEIAVLAERYPTPFHLYDEAVSVKTPAG